MTNTEATDYEVGSRIEVLSDTYSRYVGQLGTVEPAPEIAEKYGMAESCVWARLDGMDDRIAPVGFHPEEIRAISPGVDARRLVNVPAEAVDQAARHLHDTSIVDVLTGTDHGETVTFQIARPAFLVLISGMPGRNSVDVLVSACDVISTESHKGA